MMYCIDLEVKAPEVLFYNVGDFKDDLKHFGCRNLEELNEVTIDRQAFVNLEDAEKFLKRFKDTMKGLKSLTSNYVSGLPQLALPRRHLALVLMGEKTVTVRTFLLRKKGKLVVMAGDHFNFSDRTFNVTCKIKQLEKIGDTWTYHFERLA